MQSLVIVIILLSLIGLYINLGSVTEMSSPELKRVENKEISADDIAEKIKEEIEDKQEFDRMGNSLKVGDGLEPGRRIINLNVTSRNAPNTRPDGWAPTTNRKIGKFGLVERALSYKNNFPYDANYLADIQAEDTLRSRVDTLARNPKAEAMRSQIILPEDESRFKGGYKFMDRAIAIIRNQVSNQNKIVPDILKIDSEEVSNRASKKIYRVTPSQLDIKIKPDIISVQAAHDHGEINSKIQKLDPAEHSINEMRSNYNFK